LSVAPFLVGIAGGSGSGKTTLAEGVAAALPAEASVVVPADAYYRDLGHLPRPERARCNFDEPAALDGERLCQDVACLRRGGAIERPNYDFATHARLVATTQVCPAPVVLVEGIFVLALPPLRQLLDLKVFVTASEETRLCRRIRRDCQERGRSETMVREQCSRTTLPMHRLHVEPCKGHADLLVSGEEDLGPAVAAVVSLIRQSAPRPGAGRASVP
jgi:uridine kinase